VIDVYKSAVATALISNATKRGSCRNQKDAWHWPAWLITLCLQMHKACQGGGTSLRPIHGQRTPLLGCLPHPDVTAPPGRLPHNRVYTKEGGAPPRGMPREGSGGGPQAPKMRAMTSTTRFAAISGTATTTAARTETQSLSEAPTAAASRGHTAVTYRKARAHGALTLEVLHCGQEPGDLCPDRRRIPIPLVQPVWWGLKSDKASG
jgi:hypothetical protein